MTADRSATFGGVMVLLHEGSHRPQSPTHRPDLRQGHFQAVGRYTLHWSWRPEWGEWRCTHISLTERLRERAEAIVDRETMERWSRDGVPARVLAHARELAERHGW
jgi:hypothetical protein